MLTKTLARQLDKDMIIDTEKLQKLSIYQLFRFSTCEWMLSEYAYLITYFINLYITKNTIIIVHGAKDADMPT